LTTKKPSRSSAELPSGDQQLTRTAEELTPRQAEAAPRAIGVGGTSVAPKGRVHGADPRWRRTPPARRSLVGFALLVSAAWATPSLARPEAGVELEAGLGVLITRNVRNSSSDRVSTTVMPMTSVSAGLTRGSLLVGVDLGGASSFPVAREDGFAGGYAGAELVLDRSLARIVAEGGMHWVAGAGGDSSHNSDAATVALPFVGLRLATESKMTRANRSLFLGVSAFVRLDLGRRQVSGTVRETCPFLTFDCEYPPVASTFDVGGVTVGLSVSLTSWSDRWFRARPVAKN
jgi:hypothetical protein